MWEVLEHRRVDRQTAGLPREILKRYEKWKDIVSMSGPHGLLLIRGLRDEALEGQWWATDQAGLASNTASSIGLRRSS